MSQENLENLDNSDIIFAPNLIGDYQLKNVEFKGICSKQDSVSFLYKSIVNLYISYELDI